MRFARCGVARVAFTLGLALFAIALPAQPQEAPQEQEAPKRATPDRSGRITRSAAELLANEATKSQETLVALPYLAGNQKDLHARGEQIILRRIRAGRTHIGFLRLDIILAYRLFPEHFSDAGRAEVEAWLRKELAGELAGRHFVDRNDNWAFTTAYLLIVGGEAVDRKDLAAEGSRRLESFLEMGRDLGLSSEYNSPTYAPISLFSVAAIASLAESPRTRAIARVIAQILWAEIALRYHPGSTQFAAPQSRAYLDDVLGRGGELRYALLPLLESGLVVEDVRIPESDRHTFMIPESGMVPSLLDATTRELFEDKRLPARILARGYRPETVAGADSYPAGFFDSTTFLTERYAIGSAEQNYGVGDASSPFQVHWSRAPRAQSLAELGTLFERFRQARDLPHLEPELPAQKGYLRVVQIENTALLLYRPRVSEPTRTDTLAATLFIPHPERLGRILAGDDRIDLDEGPVTLVDPRPVFIEDAGVFFALHPLPASDLGRDHAVRIERNGDRLEISNINRWSQEARPLTRREALGVSNGWVVEVADQTQYPSFEAFVAQVASPEIEVHEADDARRVSYRRPGRKIEVGQRIASDAIEWKRFDGIPAPSPVLDSPQMSKSLDGRSALGAYSIEGGSPHLVLAGKGDRNLVYVAPHREPAALRIESPTGLLSSPAFALGRIEIRSGESFDIIVDAVAQPAPLQIQGELATRLGRFILNGVDRSAEIDRAEAPIVLPLPREAPLPPATLQATLSWQKAMDPRTNRGSVSLQLRNTGQTPLRDVWVTFRALGPGRGLSKPSHYLERIEPGQRKKLGWPLRGKPGTEVQATLTARNSKALQVSTE